MAEIVLGRLTGPSGFERAVVIKRILPQFLEEKAFVDMFLDEARIAAAIRHPNVVQHQELGRDGGDLYLVMEYLEGESLSNVLRRAHARRVELDLPTCTFVMAEACAGAHAAHELTDAEGRNVGLVHRDLSPQNVFVSYQGTIKLLDFGIAKAADRITKTEAGMLKGKFAYMSPEQARGEPLDRRSDVFALGIVLYELTTRMRLFHRPTSTGTLRAALEHRIAKPSDVVAFDYPEALEAVVMRALARDPAKRFESAKDMRRALLEAMRTFATDVMPEETLARTMTALFGERIEQKREMLARLREGVALEPVPRAEVDVDVELPTVAHHSEPNRPGDGVREPRRVALLAIPLVAALALASLLFLYAGRGPAAADVAPVPAVAAPADVDVRIASEPAGARVLVAGVERGLTPLQLSIPRGDAPVRVRLELEGHAPVEEDVVPDVARSVRLVMPALPSAPEPAPIAPVARRRPRPQVSEAPAAPRDPPRAEFPQF
jgi:serine/threonine-protein kinase